MENSNSMELARRFMLNPLSINDYKVEGLEDLETFEKIFEIAPNLFTALNDKKKTEQICIIAVNKKPNLFEYIPKKLRTEKVKLSLLEKHVDVINYFTKDDISYDVVKYIYQLHPYMFADMDRDLLKSCEVYKRRLIKEKVEVKYNDDTALDDVEKKIFDEL